MPEGDTFSFKELTQTPSIKGDERKSGVIPAPEPVGLLGESFSFEELSTPTGTSFVPLPVKVYKPKLVEDDNPEEDIDPLTNFFRVIYKDVIIGTKASLQEVKGEHREALETLYEGEEEYRTDSGASAFFGHTISSIAPTALVIGAGLIGAPITASILAIGALGYYMLGGAGGALRQLRIYEDESGKDFSPAVESSVAIGAGLAIGVSEMLGAKIIGRKLMSGLTKVALKEIGDAYRRKELALAAKLITKEIVKSGAFSAGIEAGEEGVEQGINNFITTLYNPDKRTLEGMIEGVGDAMKMGAMGGLILGGAGRGLKLGVDRHDLIRMSGDYLNKETANQLIADIQVRMPQISQEEATGATMLLVARANKLGREVHEVLSDPALHKHIFAENNQDIVDGIKETTFPDLLKSIGHIYEETLTVEEQATANKLFKVGEGVYDKGIAKQLQKELWLDAHNLEIISKKTGKSITEIIAEKFADNSNRMVTLYRGLRGVTDKKGHYWTTNLEKAKGFATKLGDVYEINIDYNTLLDPEVSSIGQEEIYLENAITEGLTPTLYDPLTTEMKAGEWSKEHSEKFAKSFQKYIEKGKTTNKEMKSLFEDFNSWMSNVYKTSLVQDKEIVVDRKMSKLFNNMLTVYDDTRTDKAFENLKALQDRQAGFLEYLATPYTYTKEGFSKLGKKLDVQYRFVKIGAPLTGLAAKLVYSIGRQNEIEGLRLYGDMYKSLRRQKVSRKKSIEALNNLVFLYEDDAKWNELSDLEQTQLLPAREMLEKYMKSALESYKTSGGLTMGFEERIMDTLRAKLGELEAKNVRGEKAKAKNLKSIDHTKELIEKAKGMHFLPIPLNIWLNSILSTKPELGRQVLSILASRKRQTFMIADLFLPEHNLDIKKSDVRLGDILASYAKKKGRDLAFLNLREAAIEEGLVVKKKRNAEGVLNKFWQKAMYNKGFVNNPTYTPFLYDYMIKNDFYQYLDGVTRRIDNIGLSSKVLNIIKMSQFINPFFLPMYDIIQGVMLGSTTVLTARMLAGATLGAKVGLIGGGLGAVAGTAIGAGIGLISDGRFRSAIKSVVTKDERYQGAVEDGMISTPYPNPLESYQDQMTAMASATPEIRKLIVNFATVNPVKIFKAVYNVSWNTAWQLDGIVRMYSYNYLVDKKGLSSTEAAQKVALFHGDYAGVPARTRNQLNRLFFTPTFKIAMGKLYMNMIHGFGQTINPTMKTSQDHKEGFYAILRMIALLGAWDMLMIGLGYARDQFGRRYIKRVETEEGMKESVLTFSAPHNMFLKYVYRAEEAFSPEVDKNLLQFLKSNTWEIHPLYRLTWGIVNNERTDGTPIHGHFEDPIIKAIKKTIYGVQNAFPILKLYGEGIEDPKARAQLQKELGQTMEVLTRYFTFTYLRIPQELRMSYDVKRLKSMLTEDVENIFKDVGSIPNDVLEVRIENFLERLNKILEGYDKEMYKDLDELGNLRNTYED